MEEFWKTYRQHDPSGGCSINAKAIGHFLSSYDGYARKRIVVTVHEFNPKATEEEEGKFEQEFHARARSEPIALDELAEGTLLIPVVIKVRRKKMKGEKVKAAHKHANLLIIDRLEDGTVRARRFEPLASFKYSDQVNDVLSTYVQAAIPGAAYSEIDVHPQKLRESGTKGCHVTSAVYVIKAGMMIALGMEVRFSSENDTERFAAALHAAATHEHRAMKDGREYGWPSVHVERTRKGHPGVHVEREYGYGGAILGGVAVGALAGVLVGSAVASRPRPVYVDPYYDPYYYGSSYGPDYYYVGGPYYRHGERREGREWRGGDRRGGGGRRGGRR